MKVPGKKNFRGLSKFSEQSLEVTPLHFSYAELIRLYLSHLFDILIGRQFIVNESSDKTAFHSSVF